MILLGMIFAIPMAQERSNMLFPPPSKQGLRTLLRLLEKATSCSRRDLNKQQENSQKERIGSMCGIVFSESRQERHFGAK